MIKTFLRSFWKGFKSFGENITIIVNTLLLAVVYLIGVGITSIVAKISRKHFLDNKIDKNKKSYWEDLNLEKKKIDEYYRQF